MKHITIFHVLSNSTGEQKFEDEDGIAARSRAMEFAATLVDEGQPVTIWRTYDLRNVQAHP